MAHSITLAELRKQLGTTINEVAYGSERVLVSRNGKDVAMIIPMEDAQMLEAYESYLDEQALEEARKHDDGYRVSLEEFLDNE